MSIQYKNISGNDVCLNLSVGECKVYLNKGTPIKWHWNGITRIIPLGIIGNEVYIAETYGKHRILFTWEQAIPL